MSKHSARLPFWMVVVFVFLVVSAALGVFALVQNPNVHVPEDDYIAPSPDVPAATVSPSIAPSEEAIQSRKHSISPTSVTVVGIGTYKVWQLPRVDLGGGSYTSPVPPNLDANSFAWDEASAAPGSRRGNVILTSHTYADGSAMANSLLQQLHNGDKLIVHGNKGSVVYRVFDRVSGPVSDFPTARVDIHVGSPTLSITVCSGQRIGPGDWSERTTWFAAPVND